MSKGWQLAPISGFRGLNLRDQPEGIGANEALDCRNVTLTDHGGVRRRDGYTLDALTLGARVRFMDRYASLAGVEHIVSSTSTLFNSTPVGSGTANSVAASAAALSIARVAAPGTSAAYVSNGVDTLKRFESGVGWTAPVGETKAFAGGAITAGAALPKSRVIGVWPGEERLVCAGGAAGPGTLAGHSSDTVWFSESALSQRFLDVNFVVLGAGDGELFQGVVAWRDMLFVFKESRFWVFTNTSTDANGVTIFQRRNVEVGVGPVGPRAIAVGRDGVYFVGAQGIYRTRGGDPELLTANLEPLWFGPGAPYFTGGSIDASGLADVQLVWLNEQLYMGYRSSLAATPDCVLQFDTRDGRASLWGVPATALAAVKLAGRRKLALGINGGQMGFFVPTDVTDNGAVFSSWWLGGFFVPAAERVVRHRRVAVWGQGRVNVGIGVDYELPLRQPEVFLGGGTDMWADGTVATDIWSDGLSSDQWSGHGVLGAGFVEIGVRGSRMALRFGSTPGDAAACAPWLVTKAVPHLSGSGPRMGDVIHA